MPHRCSPPTLVVVGAGPTAVGVLERLVANAPEFSGTERLQVHLVDPHPPGGGRVWRSAQSALLWANSLAADVTVLPDRSVTVAGPVGEGTTLWQWVERVARALPADDPVGTEARRLTPTGFPSRPLVSAYLGWVLATVTDVARPWADVHLHATRVEDVRLGPDGGGTVTLADGVVLEADAVLLAQGHLDAHPTAGERALTTRATARGLTYVPPGYTADLDLSALQPGEDVLVRGIGLAFVDLMVLLTGARGGRFVPDGDGLRYLPSGREPVLYVGSRRGVPYRSKLGYMWPGPPVAPRFLTPAGVDAAFGRTRRLDLRTDLAPLIERELGWAHYTELFRAHPERTTGTWEDVAAAYVDGVEDLPDVIAAAVPDPADRFDLPTRDRPLAGRRFGSDAELQEAVRAHVRADLARAADPAYSADAAVFTALLICHGTLAGLMRAGRLTARSEAEDLPGWWMNLFSYLASGPPAPRLAELVALSEAGVVRFLGADTEISLDDEAGVFRARSASVGTVTEARALVEARVPAPDVASTPDPLLSSMLLRGSAAEKVLHEAGLTHGTGRLHVDAAHRVVDATGRPQQRLFAAGFWTSGGQVAAFARPRTDAPFFHQNDALARTLWHELTPERPVAVKPVAVEVAS
ncbi:adenylate cyclase [Modestobacter sp. I12A-02628]|uniref:FAD/NAD(P)-binding protein n=1 Tax=Goekera deserti TaxID=2497753 RepID=A0A7K3WG53_9ACTN|nr:FAD/NAD(P)-binding protein [Goekera deserti]MPQ96553.1 adenylate cyclase [Goekera deserti]NDI47134.1 adenylate cyclase [Goekera deserti]NEL55468.1 FAD/NAD(P)-binding protein [Goekera deserti]